MAVTPLTKSGNVETSKPPPFPPPRATGTSATTGPAQLVPHTLNKSKSPANTSPWSVADRQISKYREEEEEEHRRRGGKGPGVKEEEEEGEEGKEDAAAAAEGRHQKLPLKCAVGAHTRCAMEVLISSAYPRGRHERKCPCASKPWPSCHLHPHTQGQYSTAARHTWPPARRGLPLASHTSVRVPSVDEVE